MGFCSAISGSKSRHKYRTYFKCVNNLYSIEKKKHLKANVTFSKYNIILYHKYLKPIETIHRDGKRRIFPSKIYSRYLKQQMALKR